MHRVRADSIILESFSDQESLNKSVCKLVIYQTYIQAYLCTKMLNFRICVIYRLQKVVAYQENKA